MTNCQTLCINGSPPRRPARPGCPSDVCQACVAAAKETTRAEPCAETNWEVSVAKLMKPHLEKIQAERKKDLRDSG